MSISKIIVIPFIPNNRLNQTSPRSNPLSNPFAHEHQLANTLEKQQTSIFNQVIRQCTQTVAILAVSHIHRNIREFSLKKEPRVATVDFHRCLDFRDGVPRWPGKINRRRGI